MPQPRPAPLIAALLSLWAPHALAAPAPETPLSGAQLLWPEGRAYPSLVTGIPPVAPPPAARPPTPDTASGIRALLLRRPDLLGGLRLDEDLILSEHSSPFGEDAQRTLQQMHRGIPIEDRGGWVWTDPRGAPRALRLTLAPRPVGDPTPALTAGAAEAIALSALSLPDLPAASTLVYWPGGIEGTEGPPPRLAWRIHPAPRPYAAEDLFIYVDAHTGALFHVEDRALSAGLANAFPQNPVVDDWQVSEVDLTALGPLEADHLQSAFIDAVTCMDRHATVEMDSDYGPVDVHVCSVFRAAAPDASGDYRYAPEYDSAFDTFAEVHAFHHTNVAIDFFRGLGATELSTLPIQVLSNYQAPDGNDVENMSNPYGRLLPVTNAYFTGGSVPGEEGEHLPRLLFAQGSTTDTAYDGDVVYHEFGHAVVAALNGPRRTGMGPFGQTNEAPALNEGSADYFACALTEDPVFAEYGAYNPDRETTPGWRDLVNTYTCADDITGSPHGDGRIWSGALWAIRSGAARGQEATFDRAILDAIRGMGPTASFEVAATLALAVVEDRLGADIKGALEAEFRARGLLGGCARWQAGEGGPTGMSAPGKGGLTVTGPAPGALQLTFEVEEAGGDFVIRGHQSHAMSSRLHFGGYDKDPNPNLRILARRGAPIAYEEIGGTVVGIYDVDAPLLPTGIVTETLYTDFPQYEARIPVEEAGTYYVLLASNDPGGGSLIWMTHGLEERVAVQDTQPASLAAGPTLERAHLRCALAPPSAAGSPWGRASGGMLLLGLAALGRRRGPRARQI